MDNWKAGLKADPIPWLLEPDSEHPSVRYFTLTELLDRPQDDPEVGEAKAAIAQAPMVRELFSRYNPAGYWGTEDKPYHSAGSYAVLSVLAQLGVESDERTAAGCENVLTFAQHESGGISAVKRRKSGIWPCTTPNSLVFLVHFSFGDDPRVRRAFAYVIASNLGERPLDCGRYQHRDCLWGAMDILHALALLPEDMRSAQWQRVIKRMADALLDYQYDFEGDEKIWLKLAVPRSEDLLRALQALAAHGYNRDPRFTPLLDVLLAQQDEEGRWIKGRGSRTYLVEKTGRPSKWTTLHALRVLKQSWLADLD